MKQNGVHCQTSMRMTVISAVPLPVAHGSDPRWTDRRIAFTTPSAGFSIMAQVRPDTTGMIASGRMKMETNSRRPVPTNSIA